MKNSKCKICRRLSQKLFLILIGLLLPNIILGQADGQNLIPGRIEGTGTYFEIKDSEYLNITLKSTEEIKVVLESIPRMISLDIEAASEEINSTFLTLKGLEPNKTYYKYQDSYKNETVFVSDENGTFFWQQDISRSHHIWFQEEKGTIFLPEQCPTYGNWDETTRTCTLNQNLNQSVEITSDNITLDCNGRSITGAKAGYGIYLNNKQDVTIKNCNVNNFIYGVSFYFSNNNIVTNNIVNGGIPSLLLGSHRGISLHFSDDNSVSNNTVSNILPCNLCAPSNETGIYLRSSSGNILISNTASNNIQGIFLDSSSNNTLRDNKISKSRYDFYLDGSSDDHFNNSIDMSNTVDGKPIYYIQNAIGQTYDGSTDASTLYCINCDSITVKDLTLTKNGSGIFFWKTQNSKIENVTVSDNYYGIYLGFSDNNTLIGNTVNLNKNIGIYLRSSNNNTLTNNIASGNYRGIYFYLSDNNNLIENTANSSNPIDGNGIFLSYSHNNNLQSNTVSQNARGIYLSFSNNNTLIKNNISDSWSILYDLSVPPFPIPDTQGGAGVRLYSSNNNTFTDNTFSKNAWGIVLFSSSNNSVYHNNFINNIFKYTGYKLQSYVSGGSDNLFNDDYPSGGNYWSDYTGVDLKSGPTQDQPGADSIGDTPYTFIGGQDRYPFIRENGWEAPPEEPELWVKVSNTPLGIWKLRQTPGTTNPDGTLKEDVLMIIPNDWVLKLISKTDENGQIINKDGYIWWKVESPGNGVVGWMASQKSDGSEKYLLTGNPEKVKELATKEERRNEILGAVNWYYNNTDTSLSLYSSNDSGNRFSKFKEIGFPIELILAIIAQESWPEVTKFDNEWVSYDYGHGVMQITFSPKLGWDNRGISSKLKIPPCSLQDNNYENCYGTPNWNNYGKRDYIFNANYNQIFKFYTNIPQSIYANIKDGLRVLQEKLQLVKNINPINNITTEEMRAISTVYRYNQGSPYKVQAVYEIWSGKDDEYVWNEYLKKLKYSKEKSLNWSKQVRNVCSSSPTFKDCLTRTENLKLTTSAFYLKYVGEKLKNSPFGFTYTNPILGNKLITANTSMIILFLRSSGEPQIIDSQGRIAGIVNEEIKEEIPNSFYDFEKDALVILFPQEDYKYQVVGIKEGSYGLTFHSIKDGTITVFNTINTPIIVGEVHQYTIDWEALSQGEKGVTLQIDANGDGIFEKIVTADYDLTYDEFILQTETVIDFNPDTLNLKSKGKVVTAYIELPQGFDVTQVDISSILLNDLVPALPKPTEIGDYDKDAIPDLMVKFDRNKVQNILSPGEKVLITITGKVFYNDNFLDFKGDDRIKTINK